MPTPDNVHTPDELIAAALRGEQPEWPDDADAEALRLRANLHGVQALLHAQLTSSDWPPLLLQSLRTEALQRAMWELRHQQLLAQTLAALQAAGIEPVLIKGTALAYSLYADPALRTRGDTDLIIAAKDRHRAQEALVALGYERALGVSGELVSYQASYTKTVDGGMHTLDLHWKINNSELLSKLFNHEELRHDARALPALCPHALGASWVHSLLLACMHRSDHKQIPYYVSGEQLHDVDRLIWLYDIHLLARRLNEAQWTVFVRMATQKGLRAVCLEAMNSAQACFHTSYPQATLRELACGSTKEPPARYLNGSKLLRLWMDFRAHAGAPAQLKFARELFFPPAAYMHERFGPSTAGLPWLYLRRAGRGLLKRLPVKRVVS